MSTAFSHAKGSSQSRARGPQDTGKKRNGPHFSDEVEDNDGWDCSPVKLRTWNHATGEYQEEELPEEILGMMSIHEDAVQEEEQWPQQAEQEQWGQPEDQ